MFAWRQFGKKYYYMWNNFCSDQPIYIHDNRFMLNRADLIYQNKAWTKWLAFCRRQLQRHFSFIRRLNSIQNFTEDVYQRSNPRTMNQHLLELMTWYRTGDNLLPGPLLTKIYDAMCVGFIYGIHTGKADMKMNHYSWLLYGTDSQMIELM